MNRHIPEYRFVSEVGSPWIVINKFTQGKLTGQFSFHASQVTGVMLVPEYYGDWVGYAVDVWMMGVAKSVNVVAATSEEEANGIAEMIRAEVTLRRTR